jgi:hypothetical protein
MVTHHRRHPRSRPHPGFLGNIEEYSKAIAEAELTPAFITVWWDRFGTEPTTCHDLVRALGDYGIDARDLAREAGFLPDKDASPSAALGFLLRSWRDRVVSGRQIRKAGSDRNSRVLWVLTPVGAGDAGIQSYAPGNS